MTDEGTATRVFIYGSCVSRDTFEYAPPGKFTIVRYIARQSLISAFSPANIDLDLSALESPFQRQMLEGDLTGSLPRELAKHAGSVDVLVWDLFDERLGVYRTPGGYVTRSVESERAGIVGAAHPPWELVSFGSQEHFNLWRHALRRFHDTCVALGLADRLVLLQVPWATTTVDGGRTPSSFGIFADEANRRYDRYYRAALAAAGSLQRALVEPPKALADTGHRWGLAPFHYVAPVYQQIAARIAEVAEDARDRSPHS